MPEFFWNCGRKKPQNIELDPRNFWNQIHLFFWHSSAAPARPSLCVVRGAGMAAGGTGTTNWLGHRFGSSSPSAVLASNLELKVI